MPWALLTELQVHLCDESNTHMHTPTHHWPLTPTRHDRTLRINIVLEPELYHRTDCKADRVNHHCQRAWSLHHTAHSGCFCQWQFLFYPRARTHAHTHAQTYTHHTKDFHLSHSFSRSVHQAFHLAALSFLTRQHILFLSRWWWISVIHYSYLPVALPTPSTHLP